MRWGYFLLLFADGDSVRDLRWRRGVCVALSMGSRVALRKCAAPECRKADLARQRWGGASVTLKILPALLCVSADYAGLAAITPILPFHLRDRCGVEDGDATAIWTGIISSSQFAAVMLACLVWGGVADRIGAKRTVQITMLGDLVTFTASAFVTSPVAMLIVRFCAGCFSPLVPSLAFIFEVTAFEDTVTATSAYVVSVVCGFLIGSLSVGLYQELDWCGVALITASLVFCALLSTLLMPSGARGLARAKRPKPQHVMRALRSPQFLTHAASTFVVGYMFTGSNALLSVALMHEHGWSAAKIGLALASMTGGNGFANLLAPLLTRRFGIQPTISAASFVVFIALSSLAIPVISDRAFGLIGIMIVANIGMAGVHSPNTSRCTFHLYICVYWDTRPFLPTCHTPSVPRYHPHSVLCRQVYRDARDHQRDRCGLWREPPCLCCGPGGRSICEPWPLQQCSHVGTVGVPSISLTWRSTFVSLARCEPLE